MLTPKRISAHSLPGDLVLDPLSACLGRVGRKTLSDSMQSIAQRGGCVLDGWRGIANLPPTEQNVIPVYRQRDLLPLRICPDREHSTRPTVSEITYGSLPVPRPGDLIVNKFPPIRAAWVPEQLYQHPIDANCLLVSSLSPLCAFWVALCINHSGYQSQLLDKTRGGHRPRINLSTLRDLPILKIPEIMLEKAHLLSEAVWAHLNQEMAVQTQANAILSEVNTAVVRAQEDEVNGNQKPTVKRTRKGNQQPHPRYWSTWVPAESLASNLLPAYAQQSIQRSQLMNAGWRPLRSFIQITKKKIARLKTYPPTGGFLRLSDVGPGLTVSRPSTRWIPNNKDKETSDTLRCHRVFAEPLAQDDCLVPSIISHPRIAFAGLLPKEPLWITDNWIRLRFRETPGAGALILGTSPVLDQLKRLTVGTQRQMLTPNWMDQLLIPEISLEIRMRWDQSIRTVQEQWCCLENKWSSLWMECHHLLTQIHGVDFK